MSEFVIAESRTFQRIKKDISPKLYKKIKTVVYPQLKANPHFGPNIKKLKGDLDRYYRYRIGSYRLFYLVENEKVLVVVVDFKHRQGAYK